MVPLFSSFIPASLVPRLLDIIVPEFLSVCILPRYTNMPEDLPLIVPLFVKVVALLLGSKKTL